MKRTGLLVITAASLPSVVAAQAPVYVIEGGPLCETCAIERVHLATITDTSFPGGAFGTGVYAQSATDDYVLLSAGPGLMSELYIANRQGHITQRIGRTGQGPGEFTAPWYVADSERHHLVFDLSQHRVTWLTKVTLDVARTAPTPGRLLSWPVAFPDGRYVLNGALTTRESVGHPLHIVSPAGQVLRSFGGDESTFSDPSPARLMRRTAVSGDTAVWVARVGEYRIERWDTAGHLLAVYERQLGWFPLLEESDRRVNRLPPDGEPSLMFMHEDDGGRLWIMIGIARRIEGDPLAVDPFWDRSESEVILEVLDTEAQQLIVSQRFSGFFGMRNFVSSDYFLKDGYVPTVEAWTYAVVDRRASPPQRRQR